MHHDVRLHQAKHILSCSWSSSHPRHMPHVHLDPSHVEELLALQYLKAIYTIPSEWNVILPSSIDVLKAMKQEGE